ncbi:amidohydrolase family protein [Phyllobacterium lublinensis]|uniref:amidohydrolase family protein n=1 Tax=Phyllobacterium lublinensis TaxID=2875708 RepID=UPI001CCA32C9|nr:amidohydrolase family protein [Phyllobacterium sp. 2063]MBZ9653733.1 amidohydrolase [Phyllobacterium sp. 2063]
MSEIVDIHPHIVSDDEKRYPITPIGGKRSDWSHERSVTTETLLQSMAEAGVDKAAVVHSSTTYGFSCEYLADAVAEHPDKLTGVFSINVLAPDAAETMRHWYEKGLTGIRIFTRGSTMKDAWLAIDDPRVFPCYDYAEQNRIPVAVNVTIDVLSQLENVLKQFPRVNFILDQLGKADFSSGAPYEPVQPLFDLAKYPNLYLKLKSAAFSEAKKGNSTPEAMFGRLVAEFGANRLAWGSNYPASNGSLKDLLDRARQGLSSLSGSDQDWILGKTALHLYPALDRALPRSETAQRPAFVAKGGR